MVQQLALASVLTFHARESFGGIHDKGRRVDAFAVMNLCTHRLEEGEFQSILALDSDAQVGKDEEALMRSIDVSEVIEARDATTSCIASLAIW